MKRLRLVAPNIQQTAKGPRLLDPVRKQLVPDGPEERVRQSVLSALVHEYGYPATALASEELVQRETANRDRADVLVRLPASSAQCTFRIVPAPETRPDTAYSMKVAALEAAIERFPPGATPVPMPDEMDVSLDGEQVRCRVLGFVIIEGEGHGLGLEPPEDAARRLGLPPVLGIQVSGYGLTATEQRVAADLGVRHLAWTYEKSLALAQEFIGVNSEPFDVQVTIEVASLSHDGRTGYTILSASDDDSAFGVLVDVDLDELEESVVDEEPHHETPSDTAQAAEVGRQTAPVGDLTTIAVIECKAPHVPLTREVTEQANRYASKLDAAFVAVTNGEQSAVYRRTDKAELIEIDDLPTFEQMRGAGERALAALAPEPTSPCLPPDIASRPDCLRFHRRYRSGTIGQSSDDATWLPILALDDALRGADRLGSVPFERHGVRVLEDLGLNRRNPGSAVGASWPGLYRDLLIEVGRGERVVFGLSLLGAWNEVDRDRACGHAKHSAGSYMIAATADDGEYEAVLQFSFDKGLQRRGDGWDLRHDGRLTAGKGAVRREILFEAIRQRLPLLLCDGAVDLGRIRHRSSVDIESLREVLARFAAYALIRRGVKRSVKAERRGR